MIIGAIGSGKSTLTNALLGKDENSVKTQTLNYKDWIVDTPGEYMENPMYYKSLMATSLEVTHVLFIQDASALKSSFPPQFSMGIPKLPIGIVTKSDHPQADVERARNFLRRAMPKGPIVTASSFTKEGIEDIKELAARHSFADMEDYLQSKGIESW
ncbi:EutP/PduV family microcompartment system protein [Fictibacillus aquaticus]|nr:EutP/PduV family microcompartment system protein [Fictibacillus aquaticus]